MNKRPNTRKCKKTYHHLGQEDPEGKRFVKRKQRTMSDEQNDKSKVCIKRCDDNSLLNSNKISYAILLTKPQKK